LCVGSPLGLKGENLNSQGRLSRQAEETNLQRDTVRFSIISKSRTKFYRDIPDFGIQNTLALIMRCKGEHIKTGHDRTRTKQSPNAPRLSHSSLKSKFSELGLTVGFGRF